MGSGESVDVDGVGVSISMLFEFNGVEVEDGSAVESTGTVLMMLMDDGCKVCRRQNRRTHCDVSQ